MIRAFNIFNRALNQGVSYYKKAKYFIFLKYSKFNYSRLATRDKTQSIHFLNDWKNQLQDKTSWIGSLVQPIGDSPIVKKALTILEHEFYLLGDTFDFLNKNSKKKIIIQWHLDPVSSHCFDKNLWYRSARTINVQSVDIKYPWELSRFQHFTLIGKAFQLTKDEIYAQEFKDQVTDWINANPPSLGINWACTMEVGIRIANWIIGLMYFIESDVIDDDFLNLFYSSAIIHGDHIYKNLENLQVYTSNHYAANIAGLFILSIFIPESNKSKRWKKFSLKELEKEINIQTLDCGWQYESSTTYHRLVTEMFLYSYIFGKSLGVSFSETYIIKLQNMISVLGIVSKPDGKLPQIGDNDSGRFLVFNLDKKYDDLCINYILETAKQHTELVNDKLQSNFTFYHDAGRFVWKNKSMYLLFLAGPKGQGGNGGHAHNDVLSYELNIGGQDIFIDPGTYTYTREPEMRNFFRSVKNHNTLYWENIEPCSLEKGLFSLREEGDLIIETEKIEESIQTVTGFYQYHGRFHTRSVTVNKSNKQIVIKDKCSHNNAILSFILFPGLEFNINNNTIIFDHVKIEFSGVSSFHVEPGFYSSGYGKITETNIIRAKLAELNCVHTIYY